MKNKPIYNLRTILYLLSHSDSRLVLPKNISFRDTVKIPDCSFWQDLIDFLKMKSAGAAGVILRAGQAYYPDKKFATNWMGARSDGLPRGSYWFYDSRETPEKQARVWADLIRADPGELPHFADFEESYGGPYGGWQNFKKFLIEFQRLSGLPDDCIGVYTAYYYWIGKVPAAEMDWFGKYLLWLAWYADASVVKIPRPWTQSTLLFWQFTSSGPGYELGVSSAEIDLSYYVNGDLEDFQNRFSLKPLPPPESDMPYLKISSTDINTGRILRMDHVVTSTRIGSMPGNGSALAYANDVYTHPVDIISGASRIAAKGDRWVHIYEIDGEAVNGWMAEVHLGTRLLNVETINPAPDPSPTPLPVLHVKITGMPGYPDLDVDWNPL